jgi:hypothetical protein
MGRSSTTTIIIPRTSTGADAPASAGDAAFGANNRGVVTLAAGTYFVPLASAGSLVHATVQGDATIAITSATVEECGLSETEAPWHSDVSGQWLATDAAQILTAKEGTGWTNTADVGANSAGNAGGVSWTIFDTAAPRYRLKVVVGTEGQARFTTSGKD